MNTIILNERELADINGGITDTQLWYYNQQQAINQSIAMSQYMPQMSQMPPSYEIYF